MRRLKPALILLLICAALSIGAAVSTNATRIWGRAIVSTAPNDGQVLTWVNANSRWEPVTPTVGGLPVSDSTSIAEDNGDGTKEFRVELSSITTGNVRVWTAPDSNTSIPIITQTITISGPTAPRTYTFPDSNATIVDTARTMSDTQAGITEAATISETNTGTDATRAVTPDALAGSVFGSFKVQLVIFDFTTDTATGDGKYYFVVPSEATGMNLVAVHGQVITAGTTNTTDVQLARCATAATGNACSGTVTDMLTTKLTIDSGENSSATAATAAVIDTANDDVQTNQIIRVDFDAVSTTAAKGYILTLIFRLP
jgi:hypothetical protein